MSNSETTVFIGWDSREVEAYEVCVHSLLRHASVPVTIRPLIAEDLRQEGLYTRPVDPLAATEFSYTRFLVPSLTGYRGWALFCDCDFLFTADIADVFRLQDTERAVMCVKHDYRPSETVKMDGRPQSVYPRKNWSSFVLWNCGHPSNQVLTPEVVNRETGAFLHQFRWLQDEEIGELPGIWNWLEGWNAPPEGSYPSGIHFTRGGPWFPQWQEVEYADLWRREAEVLLESNGKATGARIQEPRTRETGPS